MLWCHYSPEHECLDQIDVCHPNYERVKRLEYPDVTPETLKRNRQTLLQYVTSKHAPLLDLLSDYVQLNELIFNCDELLRDYSKQVSAEQLLSLLTCK